MPPHLGPGARVDDHIGDVDQEVGHKDPEDDEQEHTLEQEEVLVVDRLEDQVAQARVGEDDLGDQCPGDQHPEREGEPGQLGQQGVAEGVAADQPAGGTQRLQVVDVVGLELVDDHVAHADGPAAEGDQEQRQERQEPVPGEAGQELGRPRGGQ
jgi:hypothetical protein